MAELAAPAWNSSEPSTPKRSQKDVRLRRLRRPADFGFNLGIGQRHRSSSLSASTIDLATESHGTKHNHVVSTEIERSAAMVCSPTIRCTTTRSESLPPTGTAKTNANAAAAAKANAVATLQRLFFEEMANGGQDASGAAARALLRLSEVPQQPAGYVPDIVEAARIPIVPPPEMEVLAEVEVPAEAQDLGSLGALTRNGTNSVAPRRPAEKMSGMRRPRGLSRVAVKS